MMELIKFIVEQFAEKPETIQYIVEENGNTVNVTVVLDESDMGKVIGRQGRIAKEIRAILKAAGLKEHKKVLVDILD